MGFFFFFNRSEKRRKNTVGEGEEGLRRAVAGGAGGAGGRGGAADGGQTLGEVPVERRADDVGGDANSHDRHQSLQEPRTTEGLMNSH